MTDEERAEAVTDEAAEIGLELTFPPHCPKLEALILAALRAVRADERETIVRQVARMSADPDCDPDVVTDIAKAIRDSVAPSDTPTGGRRR